MNLLLFSELVDQSESEGPVIQGKLSRVKPKYSYFCDTVDHIKLWGLTCLCVLTSGKVIYTLRLCVFGFCVQRPVYA